MSEVFCFGDSRRLHPIKCKCGSTRFEYVNNTEWKTGDGVFYNYMDNWTCALCGLEMHNRKMELVKA